MKSSKPRASLASRPARRPLLAAALLAAALLAGCSDDGGKNDPPDAGPDVDAPPACFAGEPRTHTELMNACTAAGVEKIDKRTVLPLLNADGTLPPLP
jgi:hypothetical protein